MSLNWKKEKEIAEGILEKSLVSAEDTELVEHIKRLVVSRLYYSVFHHSLDCAESFSKYLSPDLKFNYDEGNAHGGIRAFYVRLGNRYPKNDFKDDLFSIAEGLEELHDNRKICDYKKQVFKMDKVFSISKKISDKLHDKLSELEIALDKN